MLRFITSCYFVGNCLMPLLCKHARYYYKARKIIYLLITNYVIIIYELSNFDHVLCAMLQSRWWETRKINFH